MAKQKTVYVCQNCGANSPKWVGRCTSCGEWNTYQEEIEVKLPKSGFQAVLKRSVPQQLHEIDRSLIQRIDSGSNEFNRVLGGGIVPGSLILLSGEPGIGKSTLVLQSALSNNLNVLYISGEESLQQISLRADRLKKRNEACFVLAETNLEAVLAHIENSKPDFVIIDSIQTLYSETIDSIPGSISQIKECTNKLMQVAKTLNIPLILIGHINKEGSIAGPKLLEHMVDVVLQFEGDTKYLYRIVRCMKNRFGSTSEIGIYEMTSVGLEEIANPSQFLLSESEETYSGIAIASIIEGIRPLLVEVQALVSTAAYGMPQRSANGFDLKRLNMLLAVLEKRFGFKLATKDVFINIAGGIKVNDPGLDMAIVAAVLSSGFDIALPKDICFCGEVSLTGELKFVQRIEQRISEAEKMGLKTIYLPQSKKSSVKDSSIRCISKSNIQEVFRTIFKQKE